MNREREVMNDLHVRELWATVILGAVRQAIVERNHKKKRNDGRNHRDFLNGGGRFKDICCWLDYDPDYMIRKIKEVLDNPQTKEIYLTRGLRGDDNVF